MQNGSVIRANRQRGPDVWEFRWREPDADGKRKQNHYRDQELAWDHCNAPEVAAAGNTAAATPFASAADAFSW